MSDLTVRAEPGLHGFFTRLNRLSLLLDHIQHQCFDRFGLRFVEYSVLRVLQLAGNPYQLSPTRLSELVVRSSGGMTQILDRLEGSGLVRRSADAADRRKVVVTLTPEGLRLVRRATRAWVARKEVLLGDMTADQFERLDEVVGELLRRFGDEYESNGMRP